MVLLVKYLKKVYNFCSPFKNHPESYAGGGVANGRVTHAGQVNG
jgi:hypothetical protein